MAEQKCANHSAGEVASHCNEVTDLWSVEQRQMRRPDVGDCLVENLTLHQLCPGRFLHKDRMVCLGLRFFF